VRDFYRAGLDFYLTALASDPTVFTFGLTTLTSDLTRRTS
jgi:hypothetical protein